MDQKEKNDQPPSNTPEEPLNGTSGSPSTPLKNPKRAKSPKRNLGLSSPEAASSSTPSCDWESLPLEVCYGILTSLSDDIPALLALGKVSVFWRQISTTEDVWRRLFQRVFHKLEPSDEYFLEHGAPKPTLLKEARTGLGPLPIGPSSYYHLFAAKYPLHRRWVKQQFTTSLIPNYGHADKVFPMMIAWRGFCVTAGSDGNVSLWDPKNFSTSSSSKSAHSSTSTPKPSKLKPFRTIPVHEGHIWWMVIQGDLCFTVGSDGRLKVMNLEPLVTLDAQNAVLEQIVVLSLNIPIWCIDVNRKSRKVVIGTQDGHVMLLSWKKGNWKQWKAVRNVKLRSGIWDVCLLPGRRFAVCANIDICIYHFDPSAVEASFDAENPPPAALDNALCSMNRRAVVTPVDLKLPKEGEENMPNRPRAGLTRNLNFIDGQLIAACSTVGLEAWNVDSGERLWTLSTRGYDVFDVGMTNNKLVCVGTDEDTALANVIVFDGPTRTFLLESGPDVSIGRVFSTCVTDGSIYVCAVSGLYHINFAQSEKGKKDDSSCVIS